MTKRLIRWMTYNLMFALLPLAASLFLHKLANKLTLEAMANSPEILFFSIMVSAISLGDISEINFIIKKWDITFGVLKSALLLGAVWSAILYGSFLYDSIIGQSLSNFRIQLLNVSMLLAVILFILSTIVQVLIGKIEGDK